MSAPPERLRASCARSLSQTRPGVPRPRAPAGGGLSARVGCVRFVRSYEAQQASEVLPEGWVVVQLEQERRAALEQGRRAKAARVGAKIAAAEAEAAARRAAAARDREALEYSLRRRQQQQGRGGAGAAAAAAAAGGGADENESEQYAQQCRALNILPRPALVSRRVPDGFAMRHYGAGDAAVRALASGVAAMRGIRVMALCDNRIGGRGAAALVAALQRDAAVEVLDLAANAVGRAGVAALAAALPALPALRELNLSSNRLRDADIAVPAPPRPAPPRPAPPRPAETAPTSGPTRKGPTAPM